MDSMLGRTPSVLVHPDARVGGIESSPELKSRHGIGSRRHGSQVDLRPGIPDIDDDEPICHQSGLVFALDLDRHAIDGAVLRRRAQGQFLEDEAAADSATNAHRRQQAKSVEAVIQG